MGLEDSLRARRGALTGILNGVDYDEWDPRRDRLLPIHYDPDHLEGKRALKRELRGHMRLDGAPEAPLAGVVSRLAMQKGIELMFEALPKVMSARPLALAVLGSGEAKYEQFFAGLTHSFPGRVAFVNGYDEVLSHWIEAGSDLFLMPSRYEPCGLNQMYSLRYGTVPVVRETGGLADTVAEFDLGSRQGTGFRFAPYEAEAMVGALKRALAIQKQPELWAALQRNGMACDFSWRASADGYDRLYADALERVRAGCVPTFESVKQALKV
jgi:starch synthase